MNNGTTYKQYHPRTFLAYLLQERAEPSFGALHQETTRNPLVLNREENDERSRHHACEKPITLPTRAHCKTKP